jgi:hypothetical protein
MMPSHSAKQHKFMEAIAHSPSFAKKVGVPQSVGKDFASADKGRKFSKGGNTMATQMDPRVMQMMMNLKRKQDMNSQVMPSTSRTGLGGGLSGGLGASGGMKKGGMAAFEKSGKDVEKKGMKEGSKADMALDKKQMMGMKRGGATKKMAGGGLAAGHKSADGIAQRGKTKGKDIAMKRGGKC